MTARTTPTEIHTAHLKPLYALDRAATFALVGMIGGHFVSHAELDRATLVRYVAEAEAVTS